MAASHLCWGLPTSSQTGSQPHLASPKQNYGMNREREAHQGNETSSQGGDGLISSPTHRLHTHTKTSAPRHLRVVSGPFCHRKLVSQFQPEAYELRNVQANLPVTTVIKILERAS